METQQVGQLVRLARTLGWIDDQQMALASHSFTQARQAGHQVRIGQALVHVNALSEQQVFQLLEQLGIVVLGCQRCGQAWNVAVQSAVAAACPNDGEALHRVATLQVVGQLSFSPVNDTVVDSASVNSATIASKTATAISVVESLSQSQNASSEDKYEVTKELGRGGMGAVYLAKDRELERDVAMKVVLEGDGDSFNARFIEEARITGQLEHPNIVPVHELGMKGMDPYFTMKFVRGQSLKELIDNHAAGTSEVSLQRYLSIFMKILDGVSFAHAHKVLHRDLKPENIMLGEHGEVLVMDWGIAKAMDAGKAKTKTKSPMKNMAKRRVKSLRDGGGDESAWTMDGEISGTPNYMSPEQANGLTNELGPSSDIFSLGVILYEMLTLKQAFPGGAIQAINKVLQGSYEDPKTAAGKRSIPPELAAVINKAMALKVRDRYRSVHQFQKDIEHFISGRAVSARKDPVLTALLKWMKRNPTLTVLALVVLPLMLFIFSYMFFRPGTLILNVEQMPANSVIQIGNEEIVLKAGTPEISRWVWPFIGAEIRAVGDFPEPFLPFKDDPRYKIAVNSNQVVNLTLIPEIQTASLSLKLKGEQGTRVQIRRMEPLPQIVNPTVRRGYKIQASVPLLPQGESGSETIELVRGRYSLGYSEPGFFSRPRTIDLSSANRGEETEIIDFKPMLKAKYEFASPILDYQFGDVDSDGFVDLVVARKTHIECYSILNGRFDLLWSRPFETAMTHAAYGSHINIADLDDDGQLDVLCTNRNNLVRLDARTGSVLSEFDIHDPRFRVLPLDPGESPSIIVGTGYKGVQRFNAQGQRLWGTPTAKYSGFSPFHQVKLPNKPYSVILAKAVQPFVFYAIRSDTGTILWTRSIKTGDAQLLALNDENSPKVLLKTNKKLMAFHIEDGRLAWEKKSDEYPGLSVSSFSFKGPERLLSSNKSRLACFDSTGQKMWEDKIQSLYGRSGFGDIDGDGQLEWICPVNDSTDLERSGKKKSDNKTKSFEIRAYSQKGQVLSAIRVPAENTSLQLKPSIVQLGMNGDRFLFLVQRQKCAFYRFGRSNTRPETSDRVMAFNIDGRNRMELLSISPSGGLSCAGDVEWTMKRKVGTSLKINPGLTSFGDLNGDGFADMISRGILNSTEESLFVVSGRDGRILFNQIMSENPGQAPVVGPELSNGRSCFAFLGNRSISVFQIDPASRLKGDFKAGKLVVSVPWAKGDAGALMVGKNPPSLVFGHKVGVLGSLKLEEGAKIQDLARVSQPSTRAKILKIDDEIVFSGALGSLFFVRDNGQKRELPVFKSGIPEFIKRGSELIAISEHNEVALIQIAPLKVLKRVKLPQFDKTKVWRASLFDVAGDSEEELLLHSEDGSLLVLNGRSFQALHYVASGVGSNELGEIVSYPAQVADGDNDGHLDLISTTGFGTRVLSDIRRSIAESRKRISVSVDPLLTVSYLRRCLITYTRDSKVDLYLDHLKGSIHERFARGLAYKFTGNARFTSRSAESPESYVRTLSKRFDAIGKIPADVAKPSERALGIQLEYVFQTIQSSQFKENKREALLERLRELLKGSEETKKLWQDRMRNAAFNRNFDRTRDLGELLLTFFPKSPNIVALYEETMIRQALTLHRSFQRSEPRLLMIRGLKHLDSARFHVYYANFHYRRNFPDPQDALRHLTRAVLIESSQGALGLSQRAFYYYRSINRLIRQKKQALARESLRLALKDVDAAVKIDSGNASALCVAGLLNVIQRKNKEALACFQKALKNGPESIDDSFDLAYLSLFNQGQLLIQQGQGRLGYGKILAARRLTDPTPNQIGEDFQFAQIIARSDKDLAKTILQKLLFQVAPEKRTIIEKKMKELGN